MKGTNMSTIVLMNRSFLAAKYGDRCWRSVAGLKYTSRWLSTKPEDPKHIFSKPPSPATTQVEGSNNQISNDGKYFFSQPNEISNSYEQSSALGQAIAQQRRRRRRQMLSFIFIGIIGSVVGYSVGYKALYLKEQSFIPLFPASRIRKLSEKDRTRIDLERVKLLSKIRVLEQLSQHEMIKEQYGVPIHDAESNETPEVQEFSIWCEDQDPCVTGIVIEPDDKRQSSHQWYRVPFIMKWRLTHRPLSISKVVDGLLERIGLSTSDLFQIVAPEKVYGSFKYEYPLHGDEHSMHIWFLGEIRLSNDSLVVYKGKYHVDVKLEQIDLLRKENGKLVRYILYKENEK